MKVFTYIYVSLNNLAIKLGHFSLTFIIIQMNSSFSEDVLQKMRAQILKSQLLLNPESKNKKHFYFNSTSFNSTHSPNQIAYNQVIQDTPVKPKGRYKVRNCRQPKLKVIQRTTPSRQKPQSLLGLKQLMKEQMQKYSIKKNYENILQKYANYQIAEVLKQDLLFLPGSVKIPHKNRYRPNKQASPRHNSIFVNGNKIIEKNKQIQEFQSMQNFEVPDSPKKTARFELKYKKYYQNRKSDPCTSVIASSQFSRFEKEQQFSQLTGWQ